MVSCLCAAAAAAAPQSAVASPGPGEYAVMTAGAVSMDEAVKMVEQRFRARVVKAETQKEGDHTIYVLRLLDESGKVRTVRVDAASGSVQ